MTRTEAFNLADKISERPHYVAYPKQLPRTGDWVVIAHWPGHHRTIRPGQEMI